MAATEFKSDVTKIVMMPRSEVFADFDWNPRHKNAILNAGKGADDEGGASETKESIRLRGQDTPVDVFPNPNYGKKDLPGHKQPWALKDGFTRWSAIEDIEAEKGQVPGLKKGEIKAVCHGEETWQQAMGFALRKNMRRNKLNSPDTAHALAVYVGDGNKVTAAMAAQEIGIQDQYATILLGIMAGCKKKVLAKWRSEPGLVPYTKMESIAKLATEDEQLAKYKEYSTKKVTTPAEGRKAWFKNAVTKGTEIGKLMGTLHREHQIDGDEIEWDAALTTFADAGFVRITYGKGEDKKTASAKERAEITTAMIAGYVTGKTEPVAEAAPAPAANGATSASAPS